MALSELRLFLRGFNQVLFFLFWRFSIARIWQKIEEKKSPDRTIHGSSRKPKIWKDLLLLSYLAFSQILAKSFQWIMATLATTQNLPPYTKKKRKVTRVGLLRWRWNVGGRKHGFKWIYTIHKIHKKSRLFFLLSSQPHKSRLFFLFCSHFSFCHKTFPKKAPLILRLNNKILYVIPSLG